MKQQKHFRAFFFLAALLLAGAGSASAQCGGQQGQVVDGYLTPGCGLLILTDSADLLVPVGDLMGIEAGQNIEFSHQPSLQAPSCAAGQAVELTCVTLLGSPAPNNSADCSASFGYAFEDGVATFFYGVPAGFSYSQCQWSLGDGTVISNQDTVSYAYAAVGIYDVCLTVWGGAGCTADTCLQVFTGAPADICGYADCVLPGDTDTDGSANVYDLLPIGVAYGAQGPPRENGVSNATWTPQYAPDWGVATASGVDYKHLDCNGDGFVNDFDVPAIEGNYLASAPPLSVTAQGAPMFWLDFEWDTIVVDDNTPAFFEVKADLMAGTPSTPVADLRGFALQLDYPEDMVLENGVSADYNDNSLLGSSNNLLWLARNRYADGGRLDLGFVKKTDGAGGFGKVADVTFIIVSDLIARTTEAMPFTVPLTDVVAVNPSGELLALAFPQESATLWVLNQTSTPTQEPLLDQQVSVFPNPAREELNIRFDGAAGRRLEAFDVFGKKVMEREVAPQNLRLDVKAWLPGVYTLKIHTDKGVSNKRVVIE